MVVQRGVQYLYNLCYRCESGHEILNYRKAREIVDLARNYHASDYSIMYQCRRLELALKKNGWRGFVEELMTKEMIGDDLNSEYLQSIQSDDYSKDARENMKLRSELNYNTSKRNVQTKRIETTSLNGSVAGSRRSKDNVDDDENSYLSGNSKSEKSKLSVISYSNASKKSNKLEVSSNRSDSIASSIKSIKSLTSVRADVSDNSRSNYEMSPSSRK